MKKFINEKVKVLAEFGQDISDIRPSQFSWDNHDFRIKQSAKAKYQNGGETHYLFSGTDGQTKFELGFNPKDLSWVLNKIWSETIA